MATKSKRGFAAMSLEKRRAIARQGGKASHGGGRKASHSSIKSTGTSSRKASSGRSKSR